MTALPPPDPTTASDVLERFANSPTAVRAFNHWEHDNSRSGVRDVVLSLVSRHVYSVTSIALGSARRDQRLDSDIRFPPTIVDGKTKHVTGDEFDSAALHPLTIIDRQEAQHPLGTDWYPPLSFNHAFHFLLEQQNGKLFTYPEFRERCRADRDVLGPLLYDDEMKILDEAKRKTSAKELRSIELSLRWRLGCAYYSFLKELWILSWARNFGHDFRFHPLADTLFRTDFWTPTGWAVAVFLRNSKYRGHKEEGKTPEGRKLEMEEFAAPVFRECKLIEMDCPRRFGEVDLPDATPLKGWS